MKINEPGFHIVQDTREQVPLVFRPEFVVVKECLSFGDYAMRLNQRLVPVCIERKSLGDLYGTMTNGYKRFKAEYERCKDLKHEMVLLIEATMRQVACGYKHSQFDGESMLKKLFTLKVRYNIDVVFGEDPASCARYVEELFSSIFRNYKP